MVFETSVSPRPSCTLSAVSSRDLDCSRPSSALLAESCANSSATFLGLRPSRFLVPLHPSVEFLVPFTHYFGHPSDPLTNMCSCSQKEPFFTRKVIVFLFSKTLLRKVPIGYTIHGVRKCLIITPCSKARL